MGIILAGSSHINPITAGMLQQHAPSISSAKGYSGLRMLRPRSQEKEEQFINFERELIQASSTYNEAMLRVLSNDWETFLKKSEIPGGRPVKLLELQKSGKEKWLRLNSKQRELYSHRKLGLIKDSSKKYLTDQLEKYEKVLSDIVGKSEFTLVYQLSVLERKYIDHDEVHLDILFANLNSHLERLIKSLKINNKFGNPVEFKFIRTTFQYYSESPFWGFREREVTDWKWENAYRKRFGRPSCGKFKWEVNLTHRSRDSTIQLLQYIDSFINSLS